jgi:hypothetical protein
MNKTLRRRAALGTLTLGLWLGGLSLVAPPCVAAEAGASAADAERLRKLLTDTDVWGPDALAFFVTLQRWQDAGERSVLVFPDRVVAGRKLESAAAGEASARSMAGAVAGFDRKLRPEFRPSYQANLPRAAEFEVKAERFLEDDSLRLVLMRPGGEFLRAGVTIRRIEDRYGKPDQTKTVVVQAQGDRRPAILTVYSFAGGAFQFVMSDLSATPAVIDRVVVDVGAVTAQLF